MFENTSTVFRIAADNPNKLEVNGYKITLSTDYEDLLRHVKADINIRHVEIHAKHDLIFDTDINLPGINLSLIAKDRIVIINPVICDLSGKSAPNDPSLSERAKSGTKRGENGADGKDGHAGASSGNFAIAADVIDGHGHLSLILNGDNGSDGQCGGDGAEGEDGVGEEFNVFGWMHTIIRGLEHNTFAILARIADNKLVVTETAKGTIHTKSDSALVTATHSFELYQGTEGKPGGKGGRNGCGGQGGYRGTCNIFIQNQVLKDKIKVNQVLKDKIKVCFAVKPKFNVIKLFSTDFC